MNKSRLPSPDQHLYPCEENSELGLRLRKVMESVVVSLIWGVLTLIATWLSMLAAWWWSQRHGYIRDGRFSLKRLNLPPGTLGWPIVGETLALVRDPEAFASTHKRYGDVYKTHILGRPTVVTTSPEAFKFILGTQYETMAPIFPKAITTIVGPLSVSFATGEHHQRLRKLFLRHLLPEALKNNVAAVEAEALTFLRSWGPQVTLPAFRIAVQEYVLSVGMWAALGSDSNLPEVKLLQQKYVELENGINVRVPLNIPGTQYYRSMQARKVVSDTIEQLIWRRKNGKRQYDSKPDGFIDTFIAETEKPASEDPLTHDEIVDNLVSILFASNSTTSIALSWIVKYLYDYPHVLEAVKAEQEEIRRRKQLDEPLTWEDLKAMVYTSRVLLESLRVANVLPNTIRVAVKDVEYKGFVIPKGWQVLPASKPFHMDPNLWPEPTKFDPSRFETTPGSSFAAFGAGPRLCLGQELAKMEILIFLHHLTTKYRWEVLETGPAKRLPFFAPYKGLPLRVTRTG